MVSTDKILDPDHIPAELEPFKGRLSPKFFDVRRKIIDFVKEDIIPARAAYAAARLAQQAKLGPDVPAEHRHLFAAEPPMLRDLMAKAKSRGLFNFFIERGGLGVLEYAPIAEILGAYPLANRAMNCTAPDTGNMELLEKFGNPEQKRRFLEPLLEGHARSAYVMTEPGVASSDAVQVATTIVRDGDEYVINGHKWYISGFCRPECKVLLLFGKTLSTGPVHKRHSIIVIPRDAKGITNLRPLSVFGKPGDHAELIFDDVRVPAANLILGEGRGFEIMQGRMGPGRIHHCMRTIGVAEQALAAIIHRAHRRTAFGTVLAKKDTIRQIVAESRLEITKSRLLVYLAAVQADDYGYKSAKAYVAMTKVDAPRVCQKIIDEAIQVHGAHGVSQDSQLTDMFTLTRTIRIADGPDIVHLDTVAKEEFRRKSSMMGAMVSGTNSNIEKYGKFKHVKGSWSQLTAGL